MYHIPFINSNFFSVFGFFSKFQKTRIFWSGNAFELLLTRTFCLYTIYHAYHRHPCSALENLLKIFLFLLAVKFFFVCLFVFICLRAHILYVYVCLYTNIFLCWSAYNPIASYQVKYTLLLKLNWKVFTVVSSGY